MKLKINKKMITILMLMLIILTLTNVQARRIGNLSHFNVKAIWSSYTPALLKTKNNSNYVLNLDQARGRNNVVINSKLYNVRNEARSHEGKTYEGTRSTTSNWGQSGYSYKLGLVREYAWDREIQINGSWSPDDR